MEYETINKKTPEMKQLISGIKEVSKRFRRLPKRTVRSSETFARQLVCILFVNSLYNRELFCIFEH